MDTERGSSLILVIVVLLALSGLGLAMVALGENEHRTAALETHQKDALYVAEIGLRVGERMLFDATSAAADQLLAHTTTTATPVASPAVPQFPQHPGQYDLRHLGTYLVDGGVEVVARQVPLPAPPSGRPTAQGFFSLYVRNNPDDIAVADGDAGTDARQDNDFVLNLVSVGWVQGGDRILGVKVIEESYGWTGVNQGTSLQKLKDQGGTSSAQFGG